MMELETKAWCGDRMTMYMRLDVQDASQGADPHSANAEGLSSAMGALCDVEQDTPALCLTFSIHKTGIMVLHSSNVFASSEQKDI